MQPAMIFASRFALNASSRDAESWRWVFPSRPLNPAEPIVGDVGLNSASQRNRTGQARPHTGSLVTRTSTIARVRGGGGVGTPWTIGGFPTMAKPSKKIYAQFRADHQSLPSAMECRNAQKPCP